MIDSAPVSVSEERPRQPEPSWAAQSRARSAQSDAEIGLDDREWALLAPFVIETGPKRGRPPRDHRRVLDGLLWIALSGSPWRDLPARYGKWSSVYRQFLRWTRLGVLEQMRDAAAEPAPLAQRLAAMRALASRRRSDRRGGAR
jgi:transposase